MKKTLSILNFVAIGLRRYGRVMWLLAIFAFFTIDVYGTPPSSLRLWWYSGLSSPGPSDTPAYNNVEFSGSSATGFSCTISITGGGGSDGDQFFFLSTNNTNTASTAYSNRYVCTYKGSGDYSINDFNSPNEKFNGPIYKIYYGVNTPIDITISVTFDGDNSTVTVTNGGGGGGTTPKVWLGATPEQSVLSGHLAERGCETVTNWGFYYSTTGGITQSQVSTNFDGSKTNILEVACSNPSIGTDFSVSNPAFNGISGTSGAPQKVYVVAYAVNENGLVISDELALNYCGQSFTLSGTGSVSATTSYPWEATTVTASDATGAVGYVWRIYSYDADDYLPQSSDTEVEYNYVFESTETAHQYLFKGPYDSTLGKTNKYIMRVTASDGTCDATRDFTFSIISGPDVVCD